MYAYNFFNTNSFLFANIQSCLTSELSTSQVRLVREKYTGCVYAMKTLNKQATLDQDSSAFFENERNIMANGSSPWLTALEYAFQDHENLYLVMEFHPGGDLLSLLTRQESQTVS